MAKNLYLDMIKKRIRRNKNWLCCIVGGTGTGKSYAGLGLAYALDKKFSIDRICFSPDEFFKIIQSPDLEKGSVILFEEAGTMANRRTWYSVTNLMISYVIQTFRYKNLIVIFTVPDFSYIDKQISGLFHAVLETKKIIKTKKLVCLKPFNISVSRKGKWAGKLYYRYPTVTTPGGYTRITELQIELAPRFLRKQYEAKKKQFGDSILELAETRILGKVPGDRKVPMSAREAEAYGLFKAGKSTEEVAKEMNINKTAVYNYRVAIKRKGYAL